MWSHHQIKEVTSKTPTWGAARRPSKHIVVGASKQVNVLLEMRKNGLSEYTIRFASKALRRIKQFVCLDDSEAVKSWIANFDVKASYKNNLGFAYGHYARFYGLDWTQIRYKICSKLPKIPSNERLEKLISAASQTLAVKLCISKETGLRPIEVCRLKVRDIDLDKKLVYPETNFTIDAVTHSYKYGSELQFKSYTFKPPTLQHRVNKDHSVYRLECGYLP